MCVKAAQMALLASAEQFLAWLARLGNHGSKALRLLDAARALMFADALLYDKCPG